MDLVSEVRHQVFCDYPPHWLSPSVRTAVFAVKTMACDGQHGSRGAASLHGLVLAMCAFCLFYFTAVFLGYEHFTVRLSCPHERHPHMNDIQLYVSFGLVSSRLVVRGSSQLGIMGKKCHYTEETSFDG